MLTVILLADFSTKHRNPLVGRRLDISTENQPAPSSPILSDVVGPITDVESADSTIPVVNDLPPAMTTTSLTITPPSNSPTAADSTAPIPTSLQVPVPVSTVAVPTADSTTAAHSTAPMPTCLEVPVPASTAALPTPASPIAAHSVVPTTTSLEVPILVSPTAALITKCPTPDADAPSTASDDVDTLSGAKKVVPAGKKSTRMRPGATLTARCAPLN
jgi:hypothetical protein